MPRYKRQHFRSPMANPSLSVRGNFSERCTWSKPRYIAPSVGNSSETLRPPNLVRCGPGSSLSANVFSNNMLTSLTRCNSIREGHCDFPQVLQGPLLNLIISNVASTRPGYTVMRWSDLNTSSDPSHLPDFGLCSLHRRNVVLAAPDLSGNIKSADIRRKFERSRETVLL